MADLPLPTATSLQAFLLAHVPLAGAMGVRVVEAGAAGVRLRLPLAPNLNHHGTAFGGSVSAAGVLAGWAMLHARLALSSVAARTVVADSRVRYLRPIEADFEALARPPTPETWAAFLDVLARRGRARLDLTVELRPVGSPHRDPAATCEGVYAAITDEPLPSPDDAAPRTAPR